MVKFFSIIISVLTVISLFVLPCSATDTPIEELPVEVVPEVDYLALADEYEVELLANGGTATGAVNSGALNYFTGVVSKLPLGTQYVIFKSGDFTTDMVFSPTLSLNGSTINGTDVTRLSYNTRSYVSGNNYTVELTEEMSNSFILNTTSHSIIYSSLGNWSTVADTKSPIISYILFTVIIILLIFVAFKFIRHRRSYINL